MTFKQSLKKAPVALFVYNRLEHLLQTVEALKACPESQFTDLIIFSDGGRSPEDWIRVRAVRQFCESISGFQSVWIVESEDNKGLAKSITGGVTQVLRDYPTVIVLEDDIVVASNFLDYMNTALAQFENDDRVISVHGYVYPVQRPLPQAFFLRGADCWGWATWRRGWDIMRLDGVALLNELIATGLEKEFNFDGAFDYTGMLKAQTEGQNDSWAIRWYASAFLAGKLTLYPGKSLVRNIGLDGSGTHCGDLPSHDLNLDFHDFHLDELKVVESSLSRKIIADFLRSHGGSSTKKSFPTIRNFARCLYKKEIKPQHRLFQFFRRNEKNTPPILFEGPFDDWASATWGAHGYCQKDIVERVRQSTLKVVSGSAAYERDGVTFDTIQYFWPLTSSLLLAALRNNGNLLVLDFGGSLGTSYFQNRKFIQFIRTIKWIIVEQPEFVKVGNEEISNSDLLFVSSVDEAVKNQNPNVVLVSSVLQYLPDPWSILDELLAVNPDTVIIDRTPYSVDDTGQCLMRQINSGHIVSSSYPMWVFNKSKMLETLNAAGYELVEEYETIDKIGKFANWLGMTFVKK